MNQDRNKLLSKIAYLYYIENLNQSQIAAKLGIYRTSISRMLTEARNAGIVKIEIIKIIPIVFIFMIIAEEIRTIIK